jgi:hypothetical protein
MQGLNNIIKKYWHWFWGLLIPVAFGATLLLPGECDNVGALVLAKTGQERVALTSQKIEQCFQTGTFQNARYGVTINVQSVEAIQSDGQNGIEIIARAWKGAQQLGFGKDGSVEWERFRVYNPPIFIAETTTETNTGFFGATTTQNLKITNYKEDIQEAVLVDLAHTISLVGKKGNIIPGKVGHTTSTFYPDPNVESTSVDGMAYQTYGLGAGVTWATITADAGNTTDDSSGNIYGFGILSDNVSGKWRQIFRGLYLFDTSAIPDTDSISSAILSLSGESKTDDLSITPNINIYSSAPASNTAVVAGDYDSLGATAFSSAIAYADFQVNASTGIYNDFTLNASGIAAISLTSISKFGSRNASYDVSGTPPTWSSFKASNMTVFAADAAGATKDPKLVIVHAAAAAIEGDTDDFIYIPIIE